MPRRRSIELSLVIPTRNESHNIKPLIAEVVKVFSKTEKTWEIIFVDDSDDATPEVIASVQELHPQVRLIHRKGAQREGGLSTATLRGYKAAKGSYLVTMDGDLQHPPKLIPKLVAELEAGADMAIASRYAKGGSAEGLDGWWRHLVSRGCTLISWFALPSTRKTTDPMTGFFAFNRALLDETPLKPTGYKILVELLAMYPDIIVAEVPMIFAKRTAEASKGNLKQGLRYFKHVARLFVRAPGANRFVKFLLAGGIGIASGVATSLLLPLFVSIGDVWLWFSSLLVMTAIAMVGYNEFVFADRVNSLTLRDYVFYTFTLLIVSAATLGWQFKVYTLLTGQGISIWLWVLLSMVATTALQYTVAWLLLFHKNAPQDPQQRSKHRTIRVLANVVTTIIIVGLLISLSELISFESAYALVILVISGILVIQGSFALWLMIYAWDDPKRAKQNASPELYAEPDLSFTAIVPCRHEKEVIAHTLRSIDKMDYPDELKEVIVVIHEGTDDGTIDVAKQTIKEIGNRRIRVVTFDEEPVNKPHGLNVALAAAKRDVVVIFDAEDEPHPELYRIVNTVMLRDKVDVVQSGVQLMDFDSKWYSVFNVLEYFFWFKSSLQFFAKHNVVPLGGVTVFFKRVWLNRVGGWDQTCLTEDGEIGFRMSRQGAKTSVIYDAKHATQESTPPTWKSFVKQRTRWAQGFLTILARGGWLGFPKLKQKLFAFYVLSWPFILGGVFVLLPVSLLIGVFVALPPALVLLAYVPLFFFVIFTVINIFGLHEFAKVYNKKVNWWTMIPRMVILFWPYTVTLGLAAARAMWRNLRNNTAWEKTEHHNAHREEKLATEPAPAS